MKAYLKTVGNRIIKDLKHYGIGIGAYILYAVVTKLFLGASCPQLLVIGLPCPGCGITRALWSILCLNFENAFYLNPVSFLIFIYIAAFIVCRYFLGKTPRIFIYLLWLLGILLIARYLYGMINWFPDRIPYVYRRNNVLANILKLAK